MHKKEKTDNASVQPPQAAQFTAPKSVAYQTSSQSQSGGAPKSQIMAYPLDISPDQDHLKIQKYNYVRPDINQSKGGQQYAYKTITNKGASGVVKQEVKI